MNRSWLSWTPRPKNGRWMWPSLFLISFRLFYPLLILLFSFLLLDLAKMSTYGSPSSYFSLSAPSSLFFFSSDLAQLSPNWPICMYRFVLNFSSPSLHYFICLFFSKILPSSCSPLPTPCLFSSPPSLSFLSLSLSPSQSLLSAKESELQECQGRLAQLEEQPRAAQTGADRATIVRMKQVSFWRILHLEGFFSISFFGKIFSSNCFFHSNFRSGMHSCPHCRGSCRRRQRTWRPLPHNSITPDRRLTLSWSTHNSTRWHQSQYITTYQYQYITVYLSILQPRVPVINSWLQHITVYLSILLYTTKCDMSGGGATED